MTLWTFADVYQSAMMAHMDRKGSLVALLPSVQGFRQFIGPNLSASVLGAQESDKAHCSSLVEVWLL